MRQRKAHRNAGSPWGLVVGHQKDWRCRQRQVWSRGGCYWRQKPRERVWVQILRQKVRKGYCTGRSHLQNARCPKKWLAKESFRSCQQIFPLKGSQKIEAPFECAIPRFRHHWRSRMIGISRCKIINITPLLNLHYRYPIPLPRSPKMKALTPAGSHQNKSRIPK